MKFINKISERYVKTYDIPEQALIFKSSRDIPEGAIYVNRKEHHANRVGQVLKTKQFGRVVVIYSLGNGEFIATRMHNLPDIYQIN